MRVDLFDFHLPEERIALRPLEDRGAAKLLCIGGDGALTDKQIRDLPSFLRPGDALVFNDTKVIPAQLQGIRRRVDYQGNIAEAHIGVTLHMRVAPDQWKAFAKPLKKIKIAEELDFGQGLMASIAEKADTGEVLLHFNKAGGDLDAAIALVGHVPLPPYIASKRGDDEQDKEDYQTSYAKHEGAVAAPTAGLHYTSDLLSACEAAGASLHFVTLHVGAGTFLPVKADETADHKMHSEIGEISEDVAERLNKVREQGGRVIAVGTTSLRLLESAAADDGTLTGYAAATDIFITPGYSFKVVDALMTNFHLPKSTLFMLVSAFSGLETMQAAYAHAIAQDYRFYSYGDACLLFPKAAK